MRKLKLIELLNNLKGNPEIVLWNGAVGDWMDLSPKLIEGELVKLTFAYFCRAVEGEEKQIDHKFQLTPEVTKEWAASYRKHYTWEVNSCVTSDDITKGIYKAKRVIFINAKSRGVTTWDRLGSISY
jgi:hypothetical protein